VAVDVALVKKTLNAHHVRALHELREAIAEVLETDEDRERLLAQLEELRVQLREQGREEAEETILELMDFVVGWCSPQMRI
jgi:flagellar motor component MotA